MAKRCDEIRMCEYCLNEYNAKVIIARFCSKNCMYKWRSSRQFEYICKWCNNSFKSKSKTSEYCSRRCFSFSNRTDHAIEKICEWCNEKYKSSVESSQYCSRKCMYQWRKAQHWEEVKCLNCNELFKRYKNQIHPKTQKSQQYCSINCAITSDEKKVKLSIWGKSDKNHLYSQSVKDKIKASNGKNISKPQRLVYEQIKIKYPDAILEHWLDDVDKSVDIFIPSENKIIEIYGTYWHCDPRKYAPNYMNQVLKKTAQEIWNKDRIRKELLEMNGYKVDIIWEKDI